MTFAQHARPPHDTRTRSRTVGTTAKARWGLLAALALVGGQAAVPAAFPSALPTASAQTDLTWGDCPKASFTAPGTVCTEVQVPKDYSNPAGEKITLTVSKIPARGEKRGVIAGNPGGPGGDALGMFTSGEKDDIEIPRVTMPEKIREHYDQIAVQPRGLSHAEPLTCGATEFPIPAELFVGGIAHELCETLQPGLVDSITTENTARDLNEVRTQLGEDRLNLYGVSYGGVLMSTYATLFPQHTDHILLDSSASPKAQWFGLGESRQGARRDTLMAMFQWIADRDDQYGLGTTPLQVYQSWAQRVNEETGVPAQLTPPPAQVGDLPAGLQQHAGVVLPVVNDAIPPIWRLYSGWSTLTRLAPGASNQSPLFAATLQNGLYDESSWGDLAEYVRDGKPHDNSEKLLENIVEDDEALLDFIESQVTLNTVMQSVFCNENTTPPARERLLPHIVDSLTGGDALKQVDEGIATGAVCMGWPLPKAPVKVSGQALQTKPLLMVFDKDSATTAQATTDMQEAMGGEIITLEGYSHGVMAHASDKVADKVNAYFGL
ncbi:alpha/beta fold hydrolase [Corynebacterium sp. zg254]|uniref:Alpha/beta hydrolase n=1 Tax=Corynebacterium zhongnanshanii TaxID=2768834 RepID=A0ABQ6VCE5_9CORY|nr:MULTISPECIES: alpha/beta fold hydrolase [Corynebacterium]KAB3519902.1 alpha/beta hydrolase [Corynebacterium zhongnanshanii]MCR5914848.1 alpha/beta fold hydrolase [Corynebacterium sp. zg254]